MPNRFYVDPMGDYTQGLAGLTESVTRFGEKATAEKRRKDMTTQAIEAYKSNDPDIIANTILKFPEIGGVLGQLYDRRRGIEREQYAQGIEDLLMKMTIGGDEKPLPVDAPSAPTTEEVPATAKYPGRDQGLAKVAEEAMPQDQGLRGFLSPDTEPVRTLKPETAMKVRLKKITPTNKLDVFRSMANQDPEQARKQLQYEFAKVAPDKYKQFSKIFNPEDEALPEIAKLMSYRDKLLMSGRDEDDPDVQALQRKIDGKPVVTPSMHKKYIDELQEHIRGGGNPEGPIAKSYYEKIFKGPNQYAPSPIMKMIKEREKLIAEGKPEDHPYIKALDDRIAGRDTSIEEMDQPEIDMFGAWFNLTGKMPSFGRGAQAFKIRYEILKSAAKQSLNPEAYESWLADNPLQAARDVTLSQANYAANSLAYKKNLNKLSTMASYIENMDGQISKVEEKASDLMSFDTRAMNIPLRFLSEKISGNVDRAELNVYLEELTNEMLKLAQNATESIAGAPVASLEEWRSLVDKSLPMKDVITLTKKIRDIAYIRYDSVAKQQKRLEKSLETGKLELMKPRENYPTIYSKEERDALDPDTEFYRYKGKQYKNPSYKGK